MEYHVLLDLATDLGYRLAMSGAETFRVEESIQRLLWAYGIESEVFAIPNCLHVSIETDDGQAMTRMRRIGYHGNDLDSVERYNSVCRRICSEKPQPQEAVLWLQEADRTRRSYRLAYFLMANFTAAFGFCLFFGGSLTDAVFSGFCGVIVGAVNLLTEKLHVNQFFSIVTAAFLMSLPAYGFGYLGIVNNADTVIIGSLMLLVPGLLFTNAMRDIIFGDTNSGTNRIVQVFLIAIAIAMGTAVALNLSGFLWGSMIPGEVIRYGFLQQLAICMVGCLGFAVIFNIHGPGMLVCALGGCITWAVYLISVELGCSDTMANFVASLAAALYAEIMARIRKYPAISYLVVSIFPLLPGAGIYYTMSHLVSRDMAAFSKVGMHTIAVAGAIAVGILMISTIFRMIIFLKSKRN